MNVLTWNVDAGRRKRGGKLTQAGAGRKAGHTFVSTLAQGNANRVRAQSDRNGMPNPKHTHVLALAVIVKILAQALVAILR